jgi:hypothetical protein
MTVKSCIQKILNNSTEDVIYLSNILKQTANETGHSYESVRGSSFGLARDKFLKEDWFKSNWYYISKNSNNPARIIRKEYVEKQGLTLNENISYDTIHKQKSREYVFDSIKKLSKPKIITLAGEHGLDVQYILKINKNSIIHNIEKDKNIFDNYCKLGLKTNNYNCTVTEFLHTEKKVDIFFYDSMGYLCEYISNDLQLINNYKTTNILCLNLMNIKNIRNHGSFANSLRRRYGHLPNPTLTHIKKILSNYSYVDNYIYNRTTQNSQQMIIYKFKLK